MSFKRWKIGFGITNKNSEQPQDHVGSYVVEKICSDSQLSLKNSATKLKEASSVVVCNNSLISGYY